MFVKKCLFVWPGLKLLSRKIWPIWGQNHQLSPLVGDECEVFYARVKQCDLSVGHDFILKFVDSYLFVF